MATSAGISSKLLMGDSPMTLSIVLTASISVVGDTVVAKRRVDIGVCTPYETKNPSHTGSTGGDYC
jgi:hypothetical protein